MDSFGSKSCYRRVVGRVAAAVLAVVAGAVNALFGGGGGLLIVPALRGCLGVEEKRAHATTIAIILPLSLVSALLFTLRGVYDPGMAGAVTAGAVVGAVIGGTILRKMSNEWLSLLFCGVMIYAGSMYLR